jgi:hypothetical protein
MTSTTTNIAGVTHGTITFQNNSQLALWNHEITGQMSDGMWENSRPHDHWKFWGRLEAKVGTELKVETIRPWECKKTAYNLNALLEYVEDRMLKVGRMAMVLGVTANDLQAADYMPATYDEWLANKASGKWMYSFVEGYMEKMDQSTAFTFYALEYTETDLRRDLRAIKAAMKTVKG